MGTGISRGAGNGHAGWPPLTGIRILDVSRLLPGAFATMILADLGADVVKIEPPEGDPARRIDDEMFAAVNRNKRSAVLDLRASGGVDSFLRLAARCDAVVEGFRPGVLEGMGLGYARLREANPRVVLCSISGFGQDGPYSGRPGHDLTFLALSGFLAAPPRLGEQSDRVGVRMADLAGAMYASMALALAVVAARESGDGQHLDVAVHEAATAWSAPFVLPLLGRTTGSPLVAGDNDVFRTHCGARLALVTTEDKFWVRFRTALSGHFPALATHRYDQREARTRLAAEVHDLLTRIVGARDLRWWEGTLGDLDVPWAPVYDRPDDLVDDPHVVSRGLVGRLPADHCGAVRRQVRFPVLFGAGLDSLRLPAPGLGEHTQEILAELDR